METKTITMIAAETLHPHPQNPRKDLGDLQELSDSIRENGVLQNLTVVPHESEPGQYTVIIGHRRLAAAQQAGLTSLPCVIAQMSQADQVKTMLMENMQRSDLTPIEQADGFQTMLDLGTSLADLAEQSGFSRQTIQHRLKLRELDRQKLEERVLQGATLMDLIKLEQIRDTKLRNKVLGSIGTGNFEWELRGALEKERKDANKPLWIEILEGFAQRLAKDEYKTDAWRWAGQISAGNEPDEYVIPEDHAEKRYGFHAQGDWFYLYRYEERGDEIKEKEAEEAEREKDIERVESVLIESSNRAYQLRLDYIRSASIRKKDMGQAMAYLIKAMMQMKYRGQHSVLSEKAIDVLYNIPDNLGWSQNNEAKAKARESISGLDLEKAILQTIYLVIGDTQAMRYVFTYWENGKYPVYQKNEALDAFYDFLGTLGYQISDEERLLMSGEHPMFEPGRNQPADEDDEEYGDEDDIYNDEYPNGYVPDGGGEEDDADD